MASNIPKRYENAEYKDIPSNIRKLFEVIKETRKGIYIHGGVGTGKTHIAYALKSGASEVLKIRTWDIRVYNTIEMLREFRLDFDRHQSSKKYLEEDIMDFKGILILDDIGAEKLSDWVFERFYLIINHRYEEMLPTIFTSNLPIADLAERIGDRTVSRIVEMCDIVKIEGKDRRLK